MVNHYLMCDNIIYIIIIDTTTSVKHISTTITNNTFKFDMRYDSSIHIIIRIVNTINIVHINDNIHNDITIVCINAGNMNNRITLY